ncbi:YiiG family protein [Methylovirgula sp. 4M-Z18]|uniref:YiiG family protein n=1 Tax=Methylovirgula sp. 4M-Z18 TaxID=2293567 RepID=UPI0030D38128
MRKSLLSVFVLAATLSTAGVACAQSDSGKPSIGSKLQAYIGCINRLSERAHQSEERYRSWAAASGPTGKERIIYGTYTIYDTSDCAKKVEAANATEPHDAALEAAGTAYVQAVTTLEPLLKQADDYYDQSNYKDDKMAKGKALHPQLMAAWAAFDKADADLRGRVQALNDQVQAELLAAIEKEEGKNAHYYALDLMIKAKALLRAELVNEPDKPDLAKINPALDAYDGAVQALDQYASAHPGPFDSVLVNSAKSYLVSAKNLMRRIRDKTPYSTGDKMMLSQQGAGWMVEGSPPRVNHDYNQLVDSFNMRH